MRRTRALLPLAVPVLVSALLVGPPSYADDGALAPQPAPSVPEPETPDPQQVLERASDALDGTQAGARGSQVAAAEATVALRDLFTTLPRLDPADRERAEGLLARPTQGANDPLQDGYHARSVKRCHAKVCVHRVKRTSDRASAAWARTTLGVMDRVWKKEVGRMGYRRPLADGRRGGNAKLDVYLVDVGAQGLFGYCAPERTLPGNKRRASGYCVLDNDFARSQFGTAPLVSLKVTAAHEFFHAVQFGYDYREDPWLMEASSTWMEERFADGANDNRRYLRYGQVRRPWEPLDHFAQNALNPYGNWAFIEYLSQRFGNGLVKRTWEQAGQARPDGKKYSTRALRAVLPKRAPFRKVHAAFLAANVTPARSYPEGEHWPTPQLLDGASASLGRNRGLTGGVRIDHMSGYDFRLRPKAGLDDRSWRLRVAVDGPGQATAPMVTLVRLTAADKVVRTRLHLDATGAAEAAVPFNRVQTDAVWVVVSNESTRFDCSGRYRVGYSCGGTPRDDAKLFSLTFETFARS